MDTDDRSILLRNGSVHTLDSSDATAEAVLIEHGVVTSVGTDAEVTSRAGAGVRQIDLGGRTVLPGLIDVHAHIELATYSNGWWHDVRFADRGRDTAAHRSGHREHTARGVGGLPGDLRAGPAGS